MKKVLLASTALVMSAGIAAADGHTGVSISGFAEMGVRDDDSGAGVQFHQDIDVTFKMSGETDGGLSFGTAIDIDEVDGDADNPFGGPQDGGVSVFISGDFGTLTLGDTDGAFDWALTEAIGGGSLQDDAEHGGYNGNSGLDGSGDGQVLRYDNTFGDFGVAISLEQDADATTGVPNDPGTATGETVGIGVKGSVGDFSFGAGYQENDADDIVGLSVSGDLGPVNVIANYSDRDLAADSSVGLAVTYAEGPLTLSVNYGDNEGTEGYGLHAGYDLGGGAEAQFGFGDTDGGATTWSLGIAMSF